MAISFESLKEDDLPIVLEIYEYYVKNTSATFHTGSVSIKDLKEFIFIGHPRYKSFLVINEGEVHGYAYLTQFKKREAYDRTGEITIYLKPGSTGKGIGTIAIKYLEEQARQVGLKVLIATISGSNPHSLYVFEKNGYFCCGQFKEVGEKFGQVLDVFSYEKILSE